MVVENPLRELRVECSEALNEVLRERYPGFSVSPEDLSRPPSVSLGDLSSSVCFEIAKRGLNPVEVAEDLASSVDASKFSLISTVEAVRGYVNFRSDFPKLAELTLESAHRLDREYGFPKTDRPLRIIVEHTSANPNGPIHVGNARNAMLGDALSRMLRLRGHDVRVHFYLNDMGRQVAIASYGYELLGRPKPEGKPDHWIGLVYAATNCIIEIQTLRKRIEELESEGASEELSKARRRLDECVAAASELMSRNQELFERLLNEIRSRGDPESEVASLNLLYERGDEGVKGLFREVVELCVEGFKQTLGRAGISVDSWDWESELVWRGSVREVVERLSRTPYVRRVGGVPVLDCEAVASAMRLKQSLGVEEDHTIPHLTLLRSDGTTLYTVRDVAYTLWKFERADRVINVIGFEQTLAQLQLKIALHAIGEGDKAERLVHYSYELVKLPGYKMSTRLGRYVTFDELMDRAELLAYEEVSKRSPELPEREKRRIARAVGLGAIRYAFLTVAPSKPVVFVWDRVLNLEANSGPFVQYAHARACSILRKAGGGPVQPDYTLLGHDLERELVLKVAEFPETFLRAVRDLRPHVITDYVNSLADVFNKFYASLPVLAAEPRGLRDARLRLVEAVMVCLRNGLRALGIEAPERM